MFFVESRGNDGEREARVPFSAAMLSPTASFGGIYCPELLKPLSKDFFYHHLDSSFQTMSLALLEHLGIDIDLAILMSEKSKR